MRGGRALPIAMAVACAAGAVVATRAPAAAHAGAPRVRVVTVATLDQPVGFTFAPNGRIVYLERATGELRLLDPRSERDRLWHRITGVEQRRRARRARGGLASSMATHAVGVRLRLAGAGAGRTAEPAAAPAHRPRTRRLARRAAELPDRWPGQPQRRPHRLRPRRQALRRDRGRRRGSGHGPDARGRTSRQGPAHEPRRIGARCRTRSARSCGPSGTATRSGSRSIRPRGGCGRSENGPECNDELNRIVEGGNFAWGPTQDCADPPLPEDTNRDGPDPKRLPQFTFARDGGGHGGGLLPGLRARARTTSGDLFAGCANGTCKATVGPVMHASARRGSLGARRPAGRGAADQLRRSGVFHGGRTGRTHPLQRRTGHLSARTCAHRPMTSLR